jgi:glutamate racemase
MMTNPIGIFDSGIGGTSILKEVHQLLPHENIMYLADSKNAPYGAKSQEKIMELSIKNTEFLLNQGCKLIIVACNTATTNAISYLRAHYEVPFVGIEPAIKPAAIETKTKSVGILATKGTLSSALFHQTSNLFARDITVIEQIGEGIVKLMENGQLYSEEMYELLESYLQPMIKAKIDHLVLGCTHYAYLTPILKDILPEGITIIDSGLAVAKQTKNLLQNHNLLSNSQSDPEVVLYTNGNLEVLKSFTPKNFKALLKDF